MYISHFSFPLLSANAAPQPPRPHRIVSYSLRAASGRRSGWRRLILIQASFAASCSGRMAVSQQSILQGGGLDEFYTQQHKHYCGIDLHARAMYVCILDQSGIILVHKNLPTTPEAFLRVLAPYREDVVVAVECIFTW